MIKTIKFKQIRHEVKALIDQDKKKRHYSTKLKGSLLI